MADAASSPSRRSATVCSPIAATTSGRSSRRARSAGVERLRTYGSSRTSRSGRPRAYSRSTYRARYGSRRELMKRNAKGFLRPLSEIRITTSSVRRPPDSRAGAHLHRAPRPPPVLSGAIARCPFPFEVRQPGVRSRCAPIVSLSRGRGHRLGARFAAGRPPIAPAASPRSPDPRSGHAALGMGGAPHGGRPYSAEACTENQQRRREERI